MTRLKRCTTLALCALVACAQQALADATTDAEALKKEGFSRLGAGDYANGITAMEKAYALVPAPGYLLNIAIAYDLWTGHCAEARAAFDRFFAACKSCNELKTAEERSGRLRDKCEVQVTAKTNPSGAAIAIDGKEIGRAPIDVKLGPGVHELTATLDGHAPHTETLTVAEGRPQSLSIALRPAEAPKVAPPPPVEAPKAAIVAPAPPPPDDGGILSSPVLWIVAGAAVIGGGVALGIVLGSGTADPSGGSLNKIFAPGGQ